MSDNFQAIERVGLVVGRLAKNSITGSAVYCPGARMTGKTRQGVETESRGVPKRRRSRSEDSDCGIEPLPCLPANRARALCVIPVLIGTRAHLSLKH